MDEADIAETRREGPGPLHREVPDLDRGSLVGRYVILDVVGQGGMGVVYAAYDPELDRKVAIKLLQAKQGTVGSTAGGQAWLQREAQSQAQLAHPNVLAVYDVGTLSDDRVFVAMELVEGETLRAWLDAETRAWPEILAMVAAAGTGLAAAHRAGLVHRDFKPENVLVGRDGRARVMDFGLAHHRDREQPELSPTGSVIGTPAYIAPELYEGKPASVASDQFALGVTLYTALFGGKPYGKDAFALPRETTPVPKPPPASTHVPARIQRAVMRAVALVPAARWPSVDALLDELATDRSSTRRRVIAGTATFAFAAAIVASLALGHRGEAAACGGTEARLAGVWDVPTKLAVHAGFLGVKAPYAEPAYRAVAGALDRYTSEWTQATVENCRATRIRGEQPDSTQALRQACLDARLEQVRDLTQILESPTNAAVDKADASVAALEPVRDCADVQTLVEGSPPIANREATQLQLKLALARAQIGAGLLVPGLGTAQSVLTKARELKADNLVAEALLLRGTALAGAGSIDDAVTALQDAALGGIAARTEQIAAQAALVLAGTLVDQKGKPEAAQVWIDVSVAAAKRSPFIQDATRVQRLEVEGAAQAARGELEAAIKTHEDALAAATQQLGSDDPGLWQPEQVLATTLGRSGAWIAATPHLERALALRSRTVGRDHPDIALLLSNLGACYDHAGDRTRALDAYQGALAIRERTYGKNSPFLVATLNNLADYKRQTGQLDAALADVTRAKAIAVHVPGTTSPLYHVVATTEAEILTAMGKAADARVAFDALEQLEVASHSPVLPTTLASRAELELGQHAWADAAAFEERSIAGFEAMSGKDALDLWKPLAGLATAKRGADPKADVRAILVRAVAIATKAQLRDSDLAPLRDELAKLP
ncbi:MAG TPA: tetratricopeptide repeat protein [Kofleriaceae bacterium]|jgi:tetratricopeptide (TPR) repeat protein